MNGIKKEDLLRLIDKELLTDRLAEKLIDRKTNYDTELDSVLFRGMEKAAENIVKQVLNEYGVEERIKHWLSNSLTQISKKELLTVLANESKNNV